MSTEIPQPLQDAMREAGFLDPRAGNPSLNQWSKESGVHTSTISRFISGGTTRQDGVKKMAEALGVSITELYAMTERREGTPWSPPNGTEKLTVRQRKALTELVLAFVDEGEERNENVHSLNFGRDDPAPGEELEARLPRLAAKKGRNLGKEQREQANKLGEENQDE